MTGPGPLAASLAAAFAHAVASFDLGACVAGALREVDPPRRTRLIAVGKAAPAMAHGAISVWDTRIERALVVAPDGTPAPHLGGRVELLRASHPLPDARSLLAASRALDVIRGAELTLALVSGGASALLCAPVAGVTLEAKRAVTRTLLRAGADVGSINVVRRHLSRIKGGGLTRAAAPGRVLALLVSDVLGGVPADIGSGPTVPDATTVADARAILARHGIDSLATLPLHESLKLDDPVASLQTASVVASPETFAAHLGAALAPFAVRHLPSSVADVDALVAEYVALARALLPGHAVVRCAEPSLAVPLGAAGKGGRASHLAARVARDLPRGVAFLAGATDGIDGSSDAAGAAVDAATFSDRARVDVALAAFDTATLHASFGSAIVLGPTGVNFSDIHVLARAPA